MKIKVSIIAVLFFVGAGTIQAQHVRVRLSFPVGVHTRAPGQAPFGGAIWIGPEWRWRGNQYESVPGYWARPQRHGAVWVPGHWKYSRRGYRWVPGHWR
ncbi:MAG: YXWGXW repeat-containing protein [Chitinophagaceae bacterium]|nr:YXWGXW repeat-containing protein [Chitinophagaceae bacterium]